MSRTLYQEVAKQANLPISSRQETVDGRGGIKKSVRRYHLSRVKQASIQNEILAKGRMVSPYGERRLLGMIVNALARCGENQAHPLSDVYAMFQAIASADHTRQNGLTAFDRFVNKKARNESTHLDPFPRLLYNIEQMQRLGGMHPWGFKLVQVWSCIDVLQDQEGVLLVRLRTGIPAGQMVTPINQNRQRNVTKSVQSLPSGIEVDDIDGDDDVDE